MPFIAAGDPDLAVTARLLREMSAAGADLIEVGFPYSDPIADGPVIQASYTRALAKQVKLKDIFAMVGGVSREISTPLVGMVSYAIIFRLGTELFVKEAHAAGFSGLIVPDLPGDETSGFAALMATHQLDLIQLIAPTTPPERGKNLEISDRLRLLHRSGRNNRCPERTGSPSGTNVEITADPNVIAIGCRIRDQRTRSN